MQHCRKSTSSRAWSAGSITVTTGKSRPGIGVRLAPVMPGATMIKSGSWLHAMWRHRIRGRTWTTWTGCSYMRLASTRS